MAERSNHLTLRAEAMRPGTPGSEEIAVTGVRYVLQGREEPREELSKTFMQVRKYEMERKRSPPYRLVNIMHPVFGIRLNV